MFGSKPQKQESFLWINSFSNLKINALDSVLLARPHAKAKINPQLLIPPHAGVKYMESFCSRTPAIQETNLTVVLQDPGCITFDWLDLESHSFFLSSDPIATLNLARLCLPTSDIPVAQIHQASDYTLRLQTEFHTHIHIYELQTSQGSRRNVTSHLSVWLVSAEEWMKKQMKCWGVDSCFLVILGFSCLSERWSTKINVTLFKTKFLAFFNIIIIT